MQHSSQTWHRTKQTAILPYIARRRLLRQTAAMLALTDAALARLVHGACEVPRRARGRWLRDVAAKLDPPRIRQDLRGRESRTCEANGPK
jgi:hypothetical protein